MKRTFTPFFILAISLIAFSAKAQVMSREDSLEDGLLAEEHATVISGYGEAKFQYDTRYQTAKATFTRNVLFVGHKFNNNISLVTELELENAKVVGGQPSGEFSLEEAYLQFRLADELYLKAGLIMPDIGIINENNLPTSYNGNDRPFVETLVIPTTWRELGLSLNGEIEKIKGLKYSVALINGLDAQSFDYKTGIAEGKFEGEEATASNLAVTAALKYKMNDNWRFQLSGYYGGSVGLRKKTADSLQLKNGLAGTPVMLGEGDIQYHKKGLSVKALATIINIPDADNINRAFASNTPKQIYGAYAEVGYDLWQWLKPSADKKLIAFGRYETLDLQAKVPYNGIKDDQVRQQYLVGGLSFFPVDGVVIKADVVERITGKPNPALIINPYPQQEPYYTHNGFINLGFGYSF